MSSQPDAAGAGAAAASLGDGMDGELTLFGVLDQQRHRVGVYTGLLLQGCFFFSSRHVLPMQVVANRGKVSRHRDY